MDISLKKEQALQRLYELLKIQKDLENKFGDTNYNIFVFGSYVNTSFIEGKSDIDIAIYTEDFDLYKKLAIYLEDYFAAKGIASDIFYVDLAVEAPVFCSALNSQIQFTDYYPPKLEEFKNRCQCKLDEIKERIAG